MASFRGIRSLKLDPGANETLSLTSLPSSVLDAFIPGYSVVSKIINDTLGFDITSIVSIAILLAALVTGSAFLSRHVARLFMYFFSASITIDSYDFLYDQILAWAAKNPSIQKVRTLRGHSADEAIDADDPATFIDLKVDSEFESEDAIFNFKEWAFKAPPRYEPHANSGLFWHKSSISGMWNVFNLSREREQSRGGWMGAQILEKEKLTLTVLGVSTKPLKDLILETRDVYFERQTSMTNIRRPAPKEQRGRGRNAWNKVSSRPSRPMATVVLDDTQKTSVLRDMNEFLHPKMPRWYANRGIPYRRGYLFFGPPGTGKTSLSFALAGVFGLDIYCLSLSEITLTEEDLILLFNSLPKRCVVLLEDIDSAGVLRKNEETDKKDGGEGAEKKDEKDEKKTGDADATAKDEKKNDSKESNTNATEAAATAIATAIGKAIETASKSSQKDSRRPQRGNAPSQIAADGKPTQAGITMSGLLNAIDGVASQEGRVLVMTTNFPEKLDDALIRPGRVDLKVRFDLARRKEMQELFMRMYDVSDEENKALRRSGIVKKISEVIPQSEQEDPSEADSGDGLVKPAVHMNGELRRATPPTPPDTPKTTTGTHPSLSTASSTATSSPLPAAAQAGDSTHLDPSSLSSRSTNIKYLAQLFASRLPDGVFSPAEIQGFLLTRKKSPVAAVLEADAWRDQEMARKEKGKNVVEHEQEKAKEAALTNGDVASTDAGKEA